MCIPRRRLHLRMTKQFSDHRKTLTKGKSARGEPVAEIVFPELESEELSIL